MKVTKIKTDGQAKTTGALMRQVVETYYKDMAPYASLSLLEIFNRIKNLPFRTDPETIETLMRPRYTMNMQGTGGDCLDGATRILTVYGYKNVSEIKINDIIMGKSGWTRITKVIDKGIRQAVKYIVSNGGSFIVTKEHLCILSDGSEVFAGNLKQGDGLFQCAYIPQWTCVAWSNDDCKFIGYYLSDGWIDGNRICISGKDGFPKEEQKLWVRKYAEGKGWKTSWHPRYIRVYVPKDSSIRNFIIKKTAVDKYINVEYLLKLNTEQSYSLLEGLLADSHQPEDRRSGKCFSSISSDLMFAFVLLYRKIGIGCSFRLITNHGGFGKHPIWRVYPHLYRNKNVTIKRIENSGIRHVYDLETEDHGIYLPDADVVVHNCDDKSIALASYAHLRKIPYRFVAIRRPGRKYLHHVATELYIKNRWVFADPTYRFNIFGKTRKEAERVIIS